ncbi:efflux RND transporter periplasmic adaptor subunit [Candidatus Pantoea multigeneris]|uniref:Efflux RND transporter periplasmic adaptor subunit n=1 Tax=Candidatus Pantoea multigeneris TaxID=2608357 RepID=A0ABX0R4L9_9GAMM|nr:efflux RND transporter periplasmic adaptor subunit [Pantoea multigeneris]NIF20361.1 efflux RND transporter periplasmic adaptor subunit [Pantoea multigeneris]
MNDSRGSSQESSQREAALKVITGAIEGQSVASQKAQRLNKYPVLWVVTGLVLFCCAWEGGAWWATAPLKNAVDTAKVPTAASEIQPPLVAKKEPGSIQEKGLSAAGLIKAQQISTVSAEVTGTIAKIYVKRGQLIKRGDQVAELDTTYQQNAVDEAIIQLHSAQNAMQYQQALLPLMKARYERQMKLSATHLTSTQDVDNARVDWLKTDSALRNATLQVRDAENVLERNQINLSKAIIRAPFDGRVVSLDAALGEIVSPVSSADSYARTGIATIVSTSPFHADVWVPESFLARIKYGQAVKVMPDALRNVTLPGSVSFISPVVDESRAAVLVQIELHNSPAVLKHNMTVHVDFQHNQEANNAG